MVNLALKTTLGDIAMGLLVGFGSMLGMWLLRLWWGAMLTIAGGL